MLCNAVVSNHSNRANSKALTLHGSQGDPIGASMPQMHFELYSLTTQQILHKEVVMILTCTSCGLRQFVLPSEICRRCRVPLGSSIFELSLINSCASSRRRNQLSLPFGSAIRSLRLRQGKTELQIARSAAVERSHLSRIERNVLTPNLDTVLRILRGLGAESIFIHIPRRS
jgi:hypothetical protein